MLLPEGGARYPNYAPSFCLDGAFAWFLFHCADASVLLFIAGIPFFLITTFPRPFLAFFPMPRARFSSVPSAFSCRWSLCRSPRGFSERHPPILDPRASFLFFFVFRNYLKIPLAGSLSLSLVPIAGLEVPRPLEAAVQPGFCALSSPTFITRAPPPFSVFLIVFVVSTGPSFGIFPLKSCT